MEVRRIPPVAFLPVPANLLVRFLSPDIVRGFAYFSP
jgi:hypothetical protein